MQFSDAVMLPQKYLDISFVQREDRVFCSANRGRTCKLGVRDDAIDDSLGLPKCQG